MPSFLALCLLLPLQEPPAAPPGSAPPSPGAFPQAARALWDKVCAASGAPGREPLRAFQLKADLLVRSGVQNNEALIDYRYLAPDCIRFIRPSKDETGRFGPKPEQYWLKNGDKVIELSGRDFKEDRRLVDDMLALARNYVALSNPAHLNLLALELPPAPPADLGPALAKKTSKLAWLALESPDFALVRRAESAEKPAATVYRVELGLNQDLLPGVAIVRERGKAVADPLLVEFRDYREHDGFKIPFVLLVHVLDREQTPPAFAERASQEVYVTEAALRPSLTVDDFKPDKK
jgi:hypothetical protein